MVIGGAALPCYSREVYHAADLDLACADREALDAVLTGLGFSREGPCQVLRELGMVVEASAAGLPGEEPPPGRVEFDVGLYCRVIAIEDLLVDCLNACRHWRSRVDCETARLPISRHASETDGVCLEGRVSRPASDCRSLLDETRGKTGR